MRSSPNSGTALMDLTLRQISIALYLFRRTRFLAVKNADWLAAFW